MTEYHFRIHYADFTAEIVLGGEWSLYDLAEFIIETVGFDFDHAFEFGDNVKDPYRSQERYTLFADTGDADDPYEPGVRKTLVPAVFRSKRKMVFLFDYGDDWFFPITCTAVTPSDKKRRFRRVLSTTGTPPVQYEQTDE